MSINLFIDDAEANDGHKHRMDRMYRVQRHVYDVTRAYYLLGRNDLIATLQPPPSGTVLEIGCGTGRNLVRAAQQYSNVKLFGVDISDEMLASAGRAINRTGLRHRVHLAQGDALNFTGAAAFGRSQYDRVYLSYTLSMIPDWQLALRHAASLLVPGGSLHVVDFGPCNQLPRAFKSGLHAWLKHFHVTPRDTLKSEAQGIASDLGLHPTFRTSHVSYAQHVTLQRPK